jgi:hypothetical protein
VKTTLDIHDTLLQRAKRLAARTGRPLRAVVEDGLRLVLASEQDESVYELADCSVGSPQGPNPLEAMSWQDLRDVIYGPR